MRTRQLPISHYKGMWLIAMFDLPTKTPEERREYSQFRNALLKEGFSMLQYSVYARYFNSEEASQSYRKRIRKALPPQGEVRYITITDMQFGKMEVYYGKKRKNTEPPPEDLLLF